MNGTESHSNELSMGNTEGWEKNRGMSFRLAKAARKEKKTTP